MIWMGSPGKSSGHRGNAQFQQLKGLVSQYVRYSIFDRGNNS